MYSSVIEITCYFLNFLLELFSVEFQIFHLIYPVQRHALLFAHSHKTQQLQGLQPFSYVLLYKIRSPAYVLHIVIYSRDKRDPQDHIMSVESQTPEIFQYFFTTCPGILSMYLTIHMLYIRNDQVCIPDHIFCDFPVDIECGFQPKKNDKVLSPKSVRNYYSILSGMMNFAVQMELVDSSPCHNIRLPRNQKKEARYYNKDEVALFLQALENVSEHELKYKAVVYVALFGGLRNGEIMGLNWDDLDEDERTISIHRTRYIKKGGIYEDVPKTQKSIREITLPDHVIALLKER